MDASTLLAVWESGVSRHPVRRALALLARAWPERTADAWSGLPVGERDAYLLRLHDELFGGRLETEAACPDCAERLEVGFTTRDVGLAPALRIDAGEIAVVARGYRVRFRVPTTDDLLAVTAPDVADARAELLERCVAKATRRGRAVDAADLPADVREEVERRMAEADPLADVTLAMTCPACSHSWTLVFDIVAYLWSELEDWAERLVVDVHRLASAYGWGEREILEMSARRRRLYLELVGA